MHYVGIGFNSMREYFGAYYGKFNLRRLVFLKKK